MGQKVITHVNLPGYDMTAKRKGGPTEWIAVLCAGALAMVVAGGSVRAAVYHVDSGGSDLADGSAGLPWATLQHAADSVSAGDEVIVHAGSYAGFIISTSGTDTAPIAFNAESGVAIDTPNGDGEGITFDNVNHVTVSGFTVVDIDDYGIAGHNASATNPMVGNRIIGCTVRNVRGVGIYVSQFSFSLLEGNEVLNTRENQNGNGHGFYVANAGCKDTVIRSNHIHHNITGIHFNGDLSVGGDGIIARLDIDGNVIHDNQNNALNMDGVQDSLVRNNLLIMNGRHGVRDYAIDAAEGPRDMVVVNNTIVVPQGGGWCVRFTEDAGGGHVVFNNILVNLGDNGVVSVESAGVVESDHNLVTPRFSVDPSETIIDLAAWRGLGKGQFSATADPADLFVNPASDFHLLEGCAAVDHGVGAFASINAPDHDLDGNNRPFGSAYDVGAFEWTGQNPPDGGIGPGPDASTPTDGGTGPGSDGGSGGGSGKSGCGCRASKTGPAAVWLIILLVGVILLRVSRGRRR